jgi:hypothetical protein
VSAAWSKLLWRSCAARKPVSRWQVAQSRAQHRPREAQPVGLVERDLTDSPRLSGARLPPACGSTWQPVHESDGTPW